MFHKIPSVMLGVMLIALRACSLYAESTIREEQESAIASGITLPDSVDSVEEKYDRFPGGTTASSASFIGIDSDWSGVGRTVNNARWGTLIAGGFYVSAWHYRPANIHELRFYRGTTPNDSVDRGIAAGADLGSDLWLGTLKSSVPNDVAVYPIYLLPAFTQYLNVEMLMFGHSAAPVIHEDGNPITHYDPRSQKVGRNKVSQALFGPLVQYKFDDPYDKAEFMARTYSSGAPSFVMSGSKPMLFSFHFSGAGKNFEISIREGFSNGFNKVVSWYKAKIESHMNTEQSTIPAHERQVPLFRTPVDGDYNGNFKLDTGDIDIMIREVHFRLLGRQRGYCWYLDWNDDKQINGKDHRYFFKNVIKKPFGDLNLDGVKNAEDEQIIIDNDGMQDSDYGHGDLNGDGVTNVGDRALWWSVPIETTAPGFAESALLPSAVLEDRAVLEEVDAKLDAATLLEQVDLARAQAARATAEADRARAIGEAAKNLADAFSQIHQLAGGRFDIQQLLELLGKDVTEFQDEERIEAAANERNDER